MARSNLGNSSYACDALTAAASLKNSIYIASSPAFISVSVFFYAIVALALYLSSCDVYFSLALIILLLVDFLRIIRMHGLRISAYSVSMIRYDCGKWQYQLFCGKRYKATLLRQQSFCSSWLLVLYLRHINGGRYIIIPRDALSKHNFRLLAFQINCLSHIKKPDKT